ncbi:MAG: glycosyl transferase, group 1 [Solirubrobacterales bacterium]|nr:glycosyl transferase, group 1 [Solirubrobacterales bacterium]
MSSPSDVAVVHDYLNQRGGAERVALELRRMWPQAPVYTSIFRAASTFPEFAEADVRTSFLQRVPADRSFRSLFPLYPLAFRSLGTLDHDVVVSSSSGWAHGVRTRPGALHVVYCHTPARWLYTPGAYLGASSRQQWLAGPLLSRMRAWDQNAARRADVYVANSKNVARRIRESYGRTAEVVYPPVDLERFSPRERGTRYLVVSRLLDYKRVDAVIRAANQAGLALDIVGSGPSFSALRELAGPTVVFHRRLEDSAITALMENCRALVLPGEEDFGITPVEAHAAGKPVVALAAGGALETIEDGVDGTFFHDHSERAILQALRSADAIDTPPAEIARRASRFSREAFVARMQRVVEQALAARAASR